MTRTMFIMRGLPGSGKSTLAMLLSENDPTKIFSTDQFWELNGGGFDGRRLREAHHWNIKRVEDKAKEGAAIIIVDNTNIVLKDALPYLKIAKEYGYEVQFKEAETPWAKDVEKLYEKNTHNVLLATIRRMLERYEDHKTWSF